MKKEINVIIIFDNVYKPALEVIICGVKFSKKGLMISMVNALPMPIPTAINTNDKILVFKLRFRMYLIKPMQHTKSNNGFITLNKSPRVLTLVDKKPFTIPKVIINSNVFVDLYFILLIFR